MNERDEIMRDFEDSLAPEGVDVAREMLEWQHGSDAQDETREPFVPTTPEQYDWALLKRSRAKAEAEAYTEQKREEMAKLAAAFDRRIAQAESERAFFEDMLARALELVEPDSKGKRRIKSAHGTVYTTHREVWQWPERDTDVYGELVAFAREHEAVTESVDKAAVKKYVKTTGEVPPGVSIESVESVTIREA